MKATRFGCRALAAGMALTMALAHARPLACHLAGPPAPAGHAHHQSASPDAASWNAPGHGEDCPQMGQCLAPVGATVLEAGPVGLHGTPDASLEAAPGRAPSSVVLSLTTPPPKV